MSISPVTRTRVALFSAAAVGLALISAAPAVAAAGTPTTPTQLFNAYQACSTDPSAPLYLAGRGGLVVEGIAGDTDAAATGLREEFQAWPLADPTQIFTATNSYASQSYEATANLSSSSLVDGQTYAWQARTVDATGAASGWSAPCYVTDDDTAPTAAPTITSANYPTGQSDQAGAPIQLTFGANGVSDVRGYEFSWTGTDFPVPVATIGDRGIPQYPDPYSDTKHRAKADTLGGSATVSLIPPHDSGYLIVTVASLDRSFNQSAPTTYSIWLKQDGPTVTQVTHPKQFGKPTEFKLTPNPGMQAASPVVSYTVVDLAWQGQTTTTVKASRDGTAKLKLALTGIYGDTLSVTSTSANGWVSQANDWSTGYLDTSPTVTSTVYTENGSSGGVGVTGTFTFAPKLTGVVSYTYSFNYGPTTTVKARGKAKSAQISWTPTASGWYDLEVYATTKSGIQLAPYDYYFTVN
ncbi:hypothetical protein EDD99_6375 [Streptomyces sp. 846.5]|nr:hypothetical protein [Streptomyces sp. 846.5]TDT98160.1 hypothetical protein EDD99_6375 [Streptomyces sp. 846.5]